MFHIPIRWQRMKRSNDNDPSEFIGEITRAQPAIAAYVRSLLPTHPDFMDVVQEVNVTLWKKQKQFRAGTNFKAWAFKTARFHVLSARRRMAADGRRLVFDPELVELLAAEAGSHDERMEDRFAALRLCLGQLREKDRDLLKIRYSDSVSIEEYARAGGLNAGTVRAVLRRLRAALLTCVASKLGQEIIPFDGNLPPRTG